MSDPILKVENLRTYFTTDAGVARAVDGVSFHVNPGETLGIVGESGSGKSVTSLSVMRLIPQPPGKIQDGSRILFRGDRGVEDLVTVSEERMRHIRGNEIAMIFQEPMTSLNPVFTVGDQIIESLRLHQGLNKRDARDKAIEMLKLVGIPIPEQRVDEYPHQLSGGMRQRVMIAMALSCDPKLLIADEPTTALDVTIQAQILELLNRLQEELHMAIILITHDLGVVAETCDRVIVMYAGQVFEEGPVDDVFHDPQNPYTEGLLQSDPAAGRGGGAAGGDPGHRAGPDGLAEGVPVPRPLSLWLGEDARPGAAALRDRAGAAQQVLAGGVPGAPRGDPPADRRLHTAGRTHRDRRRHRSRRLARRPAAAGGRRRPDVRPRRREGADGDCRRPRRHAGRTAFRRSRSPRSGRSCRRPRATATCAARRRTTWSRPRTRCSWCGG
jgi:ABC-type dipeptide/oligopeptide/nickel transport system ATPase component